jgi:radical SAM protein with 4Fe4S-binding SPASM domain
MLKPFTFVQWLATNNCNLFCPFCESSAGVEGQGELNRAEVEKLLDDLHGMGIKRLFVSGGEPLMRPDIVPIMAYANSRNLQLGLATNGWHVQELEDSFKKLAFFLCFTSLDGMPDYHDSIRGREHAFDRALQGLEVFARMKVPVRMVNTVVHPENICQLESLAAIVKDSPATSWRLTPVSNVGRAAGENDYELSRAQLQYLASFVDRHRGKLTVDFGESHMYLSCFAGHSSGKPFFCGAGLTRCSIMPDGEVLGCQQVFDKQFSEGNIRDRGFPQIWKGGFSRFREKYVPQSCCDCSHFDGCRSGCWAERENRGSCMKSVWYEEKQAK